jgi:tetratricopeptide (TPR) repeat protein
MTRTGALRTIGWLAAWLVASGSAIAEPWVPGDDSLIVLRVAGSPEQQALTALERAVDARPSDPLALQALIDAYLRIGRHTAEPRYFGRAEALLASIGSDAQWSPGWALRMADIWQYRHEYDQALGLIERVLAADPYEPRALLMRAAIRQTQGRFDLAHADCRTLLARGEATLGTACLAQALSMTGKLAQAERLLTALLARAEKLPASQRVWMLSALADTEERLGHTRRAEATLRAALQTDADAHYARLALADLLLDDERAAEVAALLAPMPQTEGALLRLAEAQRRLAYPHPDAAKLRERFEEASRRGERLHRRDLARLHLNVLGDRQAALSWALANWKEQREPADARLLARAALAAGDRAALEALRQWREQTGYEDFRLDRILAQGGRS